MLPGSVATLTDLGHGDRTIFKFMPTVYFTRFKNHQKQYQSIIIIIVITQYYARNLLRTLRKGPIKLLIFRDVGVYFIFY